MAQNATFFQKKFFSMLATLAAVSDTTIPTLHFMQKVSKILQFYCFDYFKDLLTPITFAKIFGFLAVVVSKIFAIENAFASNHNFN